VILAAILVFIFIKEPKVYEEQTKEEISLISSLRDVLRDPDRSALRILLAIFSWFVAYSAIEAFFTLYANKHLGLEEADGARLLGQLSLIFVLFAIPSGYIGSKIGRRITIMSGISLMTLAMWMMYFLPAPVLITVLGKAPVLGTIPVLGLLLMLAGFAWSLININSLPMVVDMTDAVHLGTYTGLYYLFSTLAAIAGPNINGWLVQLTGNNYNNVMLLAPLFMVIAFILMIGVKRGEAVLNLEMQHGA
jgi:MFS family permease